MNRPSNFLVRSAASTSAESDTGEGDDSLEARLADFSQDEPWRPRSGRRNGREKLQAGLRGLKYALRGDSSFFAHAYRGLFLAITAVLMGIGPTHWCLLIVAGGLVIIAELCHSAIDTLARALGDPESPGLSVAREIATAAVLVAVILFLVVASIVLVTRMTFLYGWK